MFDLPSFIDDCRTAAGEPDAQERIRGLMEDAFRDPDALRHALRAVDPDGRNAMLYRSQELTVLHAVTPAGFVSPIHNHCMWAAIGVLDGAERNLFYRRTESRTGVPTGPDRVAPSDQVVLTPASGIFVLPADGIHAIRVEGDRAAEGLHVYGGDLMNQPGRSMWRPDTVEEQSYDYKTLMIWASRMRRGVPL
jgi:predicted metal-dependent enzyme (double-stranded beta helix superfamily)